MRRLCDAPRSEHPVPQRPGHLAKPPPSMGRDRLVRQLAVHDAGHDVPQPTGSLHHPALRLGRPGTRRHGSQRTQNAQNPTTAPRTPGVYVVESGRARWIVWEDGVEELVPASRFGPTTHASGRSGRVRQADRRGSLGLPSPWKVLGRIIRDRRRSTVLNDSVAGHRPRAHHSQRFSIMRDRFRFNV